MPAAAWQCSVATRPDRATTWCRTGSGTKLSGRGGRWCSTRRFVRACRGMRMWWGRPVFRWPNIFYVSFAHFRLSFMPWCVGSFCFCLCFWGGVFCLWREFSAFFVFLIDECMDGGGKRVLSRGPDVQSAVPPPACAPTPAPIQSNTYSPTLPTLFPSP